MIDVSSGFVLVEPIAAPARGEDETLLLLGDSIGMNGRNVGSGDVSAADERAMDCIMLFVDLGVGFAGEVELAVPLFVGRAASSSSEESSAITSVPARPSGRKGRSLGGDVCDKLVGCGCGNGEGERDHSLPVSSLKRLAVCS